MRRALPLIAAAVAGLALAACSDHSAKMVSEDTYPGLPAGAVEPLKAAKSEPFTLPPDRPSRGSGPPSSL